jgi:uncharacterized phage protein gp47/JayE
MSYTAPTIGPQGLTIPSYSDIQADLLAQYQSIYGASAYLGVDSADYQWISIVSLRISDTMQALQGVYNARAPLTAIGSDLDGIVKLNGIARKAASSSTAVLTLSGTAGAVITNGIVRDSSGFLWTLPASCTIGGGGSSNFTAICQTTGAINAAIGAISIIATPQAGWTSVTNAAIAAPGQPVESDSQLRARQSLSVALPSITMLAGTIAAIAAVPNVTRYNVLENPTGSTDSYGNPAHSITAVVEGGADADVAQAIYNNRGIGCLTNGTTTITVTDAFSGSTMPISFDRPTNVPIYVSLNVHALTGFTSSTTAAIQTAIVNYLNSLQIGELVVLSELYGAALTVRPNPDLPMFSIRALTLGTTATPTGTSDLTLSFYQVAEGIANNVVITSV